MFTGIWFEGRLRIEEAETTTRGDDWVLVEPLAVTWAAGDYPGFPDNRIEVPAGFVNDLSSIPRAFRSIIPVVGLQNKPSVIHDYLYENRLGARDLADRFFLDAMRDVGVNWMRRWTMYWAVRAGGWVAWNA